MDSSEEGGNREFHRPDATDEHEPRLEDRIDRIRETLIEYIYSPSFELPGASDRILPMNVDLEAVHGGQDDLAVSPPESTPPYLADLYALPLLSRDDEYTLFQRMNFLKYRADRLRDELATSRVPQSICDRIETKLAMARRLRNRIVQSNLRLVVSIAKNLARNSHEMDELISDGNLPLLRAVEIFDFERGTRFSTYATWAIKHFLHRSSTKLLKKRKTFLNDQQFTLEHLTKQSVKSLKHEPLDMDPSLVDYESMLCQLDDRSRSIVSMRFGLGHDRRPHKFREIASKWGVSTERARQLFTRAIDNLRNDHAAQQSV